MRILMVGTGYVGLVSGACFSDFGHEVCCVDRDTSKIDALRRGEIPIWEPGLDALVAANAKAGRLTFTTSLAEGAKGADAIFIAVGTPSRRGDGFADLSYVFGAAKEIAAVLDHFAVIVTKSTVPVGTGDQVERTIRELRPDADFAVVSNPEFLREGAAIEDFKRPDRVVVGTEDPRARDVMERLYRPLNLNRAPLMFTSRRTSELIKYAANAFLATKITFINEMAELCEAVGADVQEVARGIGLDNRIGPKFLHAGPGFGGSCFPKDTLALMQTAQQAGAPIRLVETVVQVNEARKAGLADRVARALGGSAAGKRVCVLGLAFKPNTDDMRDAPSLALLPRLREMGAEIVAHDPAAGAQAKAMMPWLTLAEGPYEAAAGADALVVVTEWDAYRGLDLPRLFQAMRGRAVVDLRNVFRPDEMAEAGFDYTSVGRPRSRQAA
jgi:UDPglucose 6-dehydrogenase